MKKIFDIAFGIVFGVSAIVTVLISPALAKDWLVPVNFPIIQKAIDAASDGDTILVANGIYKGKGNRDLDFKGKRITLKSKNGPRDCIIDCEGMGRGLIFQSGEDVNSIVNGFTIQNGYSTGGGGIYCKDSSPSITDCVLKENWTFSGGYYGGNPQEANGGGIYCLNSSPSFIQCSIIGNVAFWLSYGGGVCCFNSSPSFTDCNIEDNTAFGGGGIYCDNSSPNITRCNIRKNLAKHGGGVYCDTSSSPCLSYCVISGNTSTRGGGIYCNEASPIINYCMITENLSEKRGGGLDSQNSSLIIMSTSITNNDASAGGGIFCSGSSLQLTNCLINNNYANSGGGGGIFYSTGSLGAITNCTIVGNLAEAGCGGGGIYSNSTLQVTNCIMWNNLPDQIVTGERSIVTYSDIRGGYVGEGNMKGDPLFVDLQNGDFHLKPLSPCIDKGTNNDVPTIDIDGALRPQDGDGDLIAICDMGAYEYPENPPAAILNGRILNMATGKPIGKGKAVIIGESTADIDGGQYFFDNISVGRHDIKFSSVGFVSNTLNNIYFTPNRELHINLALVPSNVSTITNFHGFSQIRGYAYDQVTKIPLEGVRVILSNHEVTRTRPDGFYQGKGVSAGVYEVTFEKVGYQPVILKNILFLNKKPLDIDVCLVPIE